MLGRSLTAFCRARGEPLVVTTRNPERATGLDGGTSPSAAVVHLDLASRASLQTLHQLDFACCVWLAGIGGEAACARDRQLSRQVNVDAVQVIAEVAARKKAFVVFPSTSQVFSGESPFCRVEDPPCPQSWYGELKLQAEACLRTILEPEQLAILRLTKVVDPGFPLVRGWIEALGQGREVTPFFDYPLSPVSLSTVVQGLYQAALRRKPGLFHLGGAVEVSYAQVCRFVLDALGLPADRVRPVSAASVGLRSVAHASLAWNAQALGLGAAEPLDRSLHEVVAWHRGFLQLPAGGL